MKSRKISLFLPSLEGGGAEHVFVQLANEFAARGFRVDFTLASARGPNLQALAAGVRVIDFHASGVLRALPKLVGYLKRERPDVLMSGLDHANVVAILSRFLSGSRTRCVISARSVPSAVYREDRTLASWATLRLMKAVYRFTDDVIANSNAVASDLAAFVPKRKLNTIYNPIDFAGIARRGSAAVDHPWCAGGAVPIVLSVGSLTPFKDFPTLVRAFSRVKSRRDCRLVIIGEGPDREKLESLIGELDLRRDVSLPGFADNPFAWMRHARVFVSSSLTEGCPNALMEALACGTPVVSTNSVGGASEVLEGGKWGRLVPVGNPDAMAAAILATLESVAHPDVRQRARDFGLARIARDYIRVLLPGAASAAER
ncbi:MAG: glycosyltransferase [Gammaproteobacteria bacterium]